MKKNLFLAAFMLLSICASAQVMTVKQNGKVVAQYKGSDYEVIFEKGEEPEPSADILLPGQFSVSATKTVQFTKSNLYWDGSAFRFEANQTDYPTSWDDNHVGHFYWAKTAAASYAESYDDGTKNDSDEPFFAESQGGITVDATSGLYALSVDEYQYLFNTRTNAENLIQNGVSVSTNGTTYANCLVIAPDDFTGTLQLSYTLEEINTLGLVCLPAAGYRMGASVNDCGENGDYWTSSPAVANAFNLYFHSDGFDPASCSSRVWGYSLRLVQ